MAYSGSPESFVRPFLPSLKEDIHAYGIDVLASRSSQYLVNHRDCEVWIQASAILHSVGSYSRVLGERVGAQKRIPPTRVELVTNG